MIWFFNQLARLPLPVLHRLGTVLGWLTYWASRRYAERLRQNLRQALEFTHGSANFPETEFRKILHANISEAGKGVMELPWVWRRPVDEILSSIKECHGWEHLEEARSQGKGAIILTPHFGCFELLNLFPASRQPMTSMYRKPRWAFLDTLMHEGRTRGQAKLIAADTGGVRHLLKALRRGECTGILPDQVPGNGEGVWTPFFGRQAYTMTLIGRLIESTGAIAMMSHCTRLPNGQGYTLHFTPLNLDTESSIPLQINEAMEKVIRHCPEQYLWSYNRYKVPRGVLPPDADKER